jgi:hypothetical protein
VCYTGSVNDKLLRTTFATAALMAGVVPYALPMETGSQARSEAAEGIIYILPLCKMPQGYGRAMLFTVKGYCVHPPPQYVPAPTIGFAQNKTNCWLWAPGDAPDGWATRGRP